MGEALFNQLRGSIMKNLKAALLLFFLFSGNIIHGSVNVQQNGVSL